MSRKDSVLITGGSGEMGHGLIARLAIAEPERPIITLDLKPLPAELSSRVHQQFHGSILDKELLASIQTEYAVDRVYHLVARRAQESRHRRLGLRGDP